MFRFRVEIQELPLQFPREGDGWIIRAFALLDFNDNKLLCLNQVRCNQQVLFISDVFNASGRAVDRKYLAQRPAEETWSTLIFPQEHHHDETSTYGNGPCCYQLQGDIQTVGLGG